MPPDLHKRAREMRNLLPEPEKRLWSHLRNSQLGGLKFRRQIVIGRFIVDFLCPTKALIVEVDGETHDADKDRMRDALLDEKGYTIIRVTNQDVMTGLPDLLDGIYSVASSLPDRWPHPNPSPEGEGL